MAKPASNDDRIVVARNRKAHHDYTIDEVIEAGMELTGSEVKSLRAGRANLSDGYAMPLNGQMFLHNVNISPYEAASVLGHLPLRTRRLLLKQREILKLTQKVEEKGWSLIPLELYFRHGWAKVSLGLAKGKNDVDRRHDLKAAEAKREIDRAMSDQVRRNRYR